MVMYAKIRRMSIREKQSVSAIARKTGLSRNTIKKWLRASGGGETKYRRNQAEKIVTAFEPWLLQALKADAHRPKRDRRTARMLFQAIRTQGFSGSYCRVTEWVSAWRALGDSVSGKSAFVPCWRAVKTDQLCSLNFDQAFCGAANYASVDKSTRL